MMPKLLVPGRAARELWGGLDRTVIAGPSKRNISSSPRRPLSSHTARLEIRSVGITASRSRCSAPLLFGCRIESTTARRSLSSTAWRARPPDRDGDPKSKRSTILDSSRSDSAAALRDNETSNSSTAAARPRIPTEHLPESRPSEPISSPDSVSSQPSSNPATTDESTSNNALTTPSPQTHNAALDPDSLSQNKSEKNQAGSGLEDNPQTSRKHLAPKFPGNQNPSDRCSRIADWGQSLECSSPILLQADCG